MFGSKRIGQNYLQRFYLIPRNRYFNIYLHKFTGDDLREDLHDHPWNFISIMLRGGLLETTLTKSGWYVTRRVPRFLPRFCGARRQHRFQLPRNKKSAVTLVFTGPRFRDWGFYDHGVCVQLMPMNSAD